METVQLERQHERRDVIQNELRWHEEEAHRRQRLDELLYKAPAFDDIVEDQLAFLDPARSHLLLEIGSGTGKETLILSRRGHTVYTIDLSYVQIAAAKAQVLNKHASANVVWVQANAEELPFADGVFSAVYGKAILHHLDLGLAAEEVKRVLQNAGRASFAEPLAGHPLIWLGRRLTPHLRTRDEHPLKWTELTAFAAQFDALPVKYFYILAPLAYFLRLVPGLARTFNLFWHVLRHVDQKLLDFLPFLRRLAWYGVISLRKPLR
ncbi:MAG: methyltransferase domain-containing protein [Caldilinea sp.]